MVTSVAGLMPPPLGISTDQDALAKYNAAIDAQLKALENRGGTNWFQIAGALANPGRTGNAGEAFGRAMDVVGKQREDQEAQAIPIAQMRAQLAGQKYEVAKEAQGLEIVGKLFNKSPAEAIAGLQPANGGIDLALMPRLAQAHAALVNNPKLRSFVGEQMKMQEQLIDTAISLQKQGMSIVEIEDRIPGAKGLFPPVGGASGTGSPTGSPTRAAPFEPLFKLIDLAVKL
jgi:hypothetical protein